MFLCVPKLFVCGFLFPFFPIFLSLRFFLLAISTRICILVPRLIFHTNLPSSVENRFVHGIMGMQVPLVCPESVMWIATSNFLELKTHLASSLKLHDTISFSSPSLLIYFPYFLGSFQNLLTFFYSLVNAHCFLFFKKNCICFKMSCSCNYYFVSNCIIVLFHLLTCCIFFVKYLLSRIVLQIRFRIAWLACIISPVMQ